MKFSAQITRQRAAELTAIGREVIAKRAAEQKSPVARRTKAPGMRTKEVLAFILERERIRQNKEADKPKPWTKDPILQQYSFCNVRRSDDRTTRWITENWVKPNARQPDLWFAMVVARLVNWPDTLAELGYPKTWDAAAFVYTLNARKEKGEKVFSGAYIVGTQGTPMEKAEYLAQRVLTYLWTGREQLRPRKWDTLASFYERLNRYPGMGSFMTAQVIADCKEVAPLATAADWWTFAASGPGSRRGLNRVLGRDTDATWKESIWHGALCELADAIAPLVRKAGMDPLHNQDLQNVLCEFDKLERTRLGEGKPRAKYPGAA